MPEEGNILKIDGLKTHFELTEGLVRAVDGVSFKIREDRTLGVIGESGCGKSVTAQSIMRILPSPPAKIVAGKILFYFQRQSRTAERNPIDLTTLDAKGEQIRKIRGKEIGMVFQEPMTSFGPLNTIGDQIMETILIHENVKREEARERTIHLLKQVGIPRAEARVDDYPHQFSGGMRQRAMIAMALSCSPRLLIADEPTTSIDVTIEAQILDLLRNLQERTNMAIMLITHNLAVVSELANEIVVMYLGKIMERASIEEIFNNPLHPYTRALWKSIPRLEGELTRLNPIKGVVPSPYNIPDGCVFHPRCEESISGVCDSKSLPDPVEVKSQHWVSCFKFET